MDQNKLEQLMVLVSNALKTAAKETDEQNKLDFYKNFPGCARELENIIFWFQNNAPDLIK